MQQLTGLDASMLYVETRQTPNHVAAFYTYDPSTAAGGSVSFGQILDNVKGRLSLSPTFRRRMVQVPMGLDHPYWVESADFELEYHVRQIGLPPPASWRQLCDLIAELHSQPIDLRRPPWELYVIEGLADGVDGISSGGFATLLKIHHAAVDGISGLELVTVLHDREAAAEPPAGEDSWHPETPPRSLDLLAWAGLHNLLKPMHALRVAGRMAPVLVRVPLGIGLGSLRAPPTSLPRTRFNVPVSLLRSVDAVRAPFADVKRARSAVPGATINDVVLTVVAGALRRYLDAKGELPDESMVAVVPISTRTAETAGTGGNQISMMTTTLATHENDPVKRLALVSAGMSDTKELANAIGGRSLADLSNAVPGLLLGLGTRAQSRMAARSGGHVLATTTVTNVPGPREPLFFTGARLVGPYGTGPILHGMGLIHLITSYVDQFAFSFTADRATLPDPAFYADCLRESLDVLSAATADVPNAGRSRSRSGGAGRGRAARRSPAPPPG